MGASCCGGEEKRDKDTNLSRKGGRIPSKGMKLDDRIMSQIPLHMVVKMQSMMRGYMARKKVKRVYGFEMTPGLLNRGTIHIEMDPVKLEEQRQRV